MKDIICKCGHKAAEHHPQHGCCHVDNDTEDCKCRIVREDLLRAHIAKLEAVVEAAKAWRKGWPDAEDEQLARDGWESHICNLIRAIDALDSTDVP